MRKTITTNHFVGLDLGQLSDHSALTNLQRIRTVLTKHKDVDVDCKRDGETVLTTNKYGLRSLVRWKTGTPYPVMVKAVAGMFLVPPLKGAHLIVDATGVGRPVVDMFRQPAPCTVEDVAAWNLPLSLVEPFRKGADLFMVPVQARLIPVTITGGRGLAHRDEFGWKVPKKELVGVLQKLLSSRNLIVAKGMPDVDKLIDELRNFKEKIKKDGGESSMEAWREGDHDDLVLSLSIACFVADRGLKQLWTN